MFTNLHIYKTMADAQEMATRRGYPVNLSSFMRHKKAQCACGETELGAFSQKGENSKMLFFGICSSCGEEI